MNWFVFAQQQLFDNTPCKIFILPLPFSDRSFLAAEII